MNSEKGERQIDSDSQQRKATALRAHEIIPGSRPPQQARPEQKSAKTGENAGRETGKTKKTAPERSKIPKFDLAEEIMAEQRKITATKRKAPGKKNKVEQLTEPIDDTARRPMPKSPGQEKIIAEIVTRDIEKFCSGNNRADNRQ